MATLESIEGQLLVISSDVASINAREIAMAKIVEGHRRTLYGPNGTQGVVAKQNTVMDTLKTIEKQTLKEEAWKQKILAPVISGLVVAAVLGALMIWKLN